jgi:hypothetical protein
MVPKGSRSTRYRTEFSKMGQQCSTGEGVADCIRRESIAAQTDHPGALLKAPPRQRDVTFIY